MNKAAHPAARRTAKLMVAAFLVAASIAQAQTPEPSKPMALRSVMQQLGQDMQAVTGAISSENWASVADLAPKIGSHAEPPAGEKMRILGWLGADAGKFRGFDGQLHDATVVMAKAATRGDGEGVIAAFANVQQRCLACHQEFRQTFQEHFYGKR